MKTGLIRRKFGHPQSGSGLPWFVVLLFVLLAASAHASEMSSASYSVRGGNLNGGSVADLTSTDPSPAYSGAAGSLGQREAIGLSGSASNLTTTRPGFWAIVAGALPSLDLDGDHIQSFLDPDDDNDGFSDGDEVDEGTDPNDPRSQPTPEAAPVPALSFAGQWLVILSLVALAILRLRWSQQKARRVSSL